MKVVLLRHTPDPDKSVALSARLCYSPVGVTELQEKMSDEEAARLVRMLVRMGHFSPIEHVTFTFAIEGVSRVLTHQLVRHRIASYSQQSQRYVKEHNFESIMPPAIAAIPEAKAKFEACMQNLQDLYNDLTDHYGIANEDARPFALQFLQFALLQPRAVGNPRTGLEDADGMSESSSGSVRKSGPGLCGQGDL